MMEIILGSIILLLLLPVGYVIAMRIAKPHSKKMKPAPTAATTSTSNGGTPPPPPQTSYGRYFWTTLLIILGLVIFFVEVYPNKATSPSFADVGEWVWARWVWILILWGVCAALFELNADTLGKAKLVLHKVLAGTVVFVLLLGSPPGQWLVSDNGSQKAADAHSMPKKVKVLTMSANGTSDHLRVPPGYAATFTGSGFTTHCVYSDGSEGVVGSQSSPCRSGPISYLYLTDTTGHGNSATYEFVRPK